MSNEFLRRAYCFGCSEESCVHREAFRRLPKQVGGLALCPLLSACKDPLAPLKTNTAVRIKETGRITIVENVLKTMSGDFMYELYLEKRWFKESEFDVWEEVGNE